MISYRLLLRSFLQSNAGLPPKQFQAFWGHDDIEMTLGIYTHIADHAAFEMSNKMDEAILSIRNSAENCSDFCSESNGVKMKVI